MPAISELPGAAPDAATEAETHHREFAGRTDKSPAKAAFSRPSLKHDRPRFFPSPATPLPKGERGEVVGTLRVPWILLHKKTAHGVCLQRSRNGVLS